MPAEAVWQAGAHKGCKRQAMVLYTAAYAEYERRERAGRRCRELAVAADLE